MPCQHYILEGLNLFCLNFRYERLLTTLHVFYLALFRSRGPDNPSDFKCVLLLVGAEVPIIPSVSIGSLHQLVLRPLYIEIAEGNEKVICFSWTHQLFLSFFVSCRKSIPHELTRHQRYSCSKHFSSINFITKQLSLKLNILPSPRNLNEKFPYPGTAVSHDHPAKSKSA